MKKLLFIASAMLVCQSLMAQTYSPVTGTGYNFDIVANGTGHSNLSTNSAVDSPGDNYCFVAQGFSNSAGQSPTSYLPASGLINSAATPGLFFQLMPYSGNNSVRVAGGSSGTFIFTTPRSASQVCILAATGYPSTTTVTVNFTDATTQVFAGNSLPNWFGGSGYAIKGISRVHRGTDVIENNLNDPRIYQLVLNLSAANTAKTIQGITFANTTAGSFLHAMAVTVLSAPSTLATDAGVTGIVAPNSGCVLTNQETITVNVKNHGTTPQSNIPVSYRLNNGTWVNEVLAGPLAANTSVNYAFNTKANLSTLGTYALETRTNLTGDLDPANDIMSRSVVLAAAPATPTITTNGSTSLCTSGTVTLTASSATPGATYQWFNNGTAISGATNATYIATVAGTYTATALSSGCSSPVSAATSLTVTTTPIAPVINAGGPLTFCTGGSVTLTASSVQGASFTWFQNGTVIPGATAATYTATASGNYTVTASVNGCGSPSSPASNVTVKATPATPTVTQAGFVLTSSATTGNQWYKNGVAISGASSRTYTTTSNGAYTVKVTTNGCTSAASNTVIITTTGFEEDLAGLLAVNVYPNPSSGLFQITLPKGKGYEITVTDLTGKVVKQLSTKNHNFQLNIGDAAKGVYMLKIAGEGKTATRKLVVE